MDEFERIMADERLKEFDSVPVMYCADCLSLRIMDIDGMDYCDKCGCTDIREADIHDWERMYEARYGRRFINS